MIEVKLVVTHDGTGDYKTPDHIEREFTKEFPSIEEAYAWVSKQNEHPWLTMHIVKE